MKTAIKVSNRLGSWISDFNEMSDEGIKEVREIAKQAVEGNIGNFSIKEGGSEFFFGSSTLKESVITIIKE